ncbi:hypothetical protein SeLEV6574_g06188 [Synchytrium endobioticum]|uniref:Uncharacterized protein n=1 Tax=Synchytrium endobioticum TaxID=286115 RepID=A0A507CQ31_9FUNG|nr:hypothetical protein SeLEV6574_g06188 [Synchytrium endobioticum]
MSKHFRIRPRCCSIKMGKNIMIATLLIFFTLTQAAPPSTWNRTKDYLPYIRRTVVTLKERMHKVKDRMYDTSYDTRYHTDARTDFVGSNIESRKEILEDPFSWSGYTYNELRDLPDRDHSWLPICLAFECLVILRALYDMKRLHYYKEYHQSHQLEFDYEDAEKRLSEYRKFLNEHVSRRNSFMYNRLSVSMQNLIQLVDEQLSDLSALLGIGETPEPMVASTDPVDKTELDLIGLVGRTSDPMVTSTDDVDWQTQELLGQHREGDSDAPPSVMFDFFRQAGEQASGFSHRTHYTEGYQAPTYFEQQSVPQPFIPHHAAESSTHGHDNRNRGKMPMHDDSSAPSCYPYYPYHSPDGEHHRR